MKDIVNKCAEAVQKNINKSWEALAVGVAGILIVFLVAWLIGALAGDFIRFRRACKLIALGKTEQGMAKLRGGSKELIAEKPIGLTYEKIVLAPYGYSRMRAFRPTVFGATILFSIISMSLGVVVEGVLGSIAATCAILSLLFGGALSIVAGVISASTLKGAAKRFYKMSETLNEKMILGEPAGENDDLLPSTILLCEKIDEAAKSKENSFESLNQLYNLLKQESKKPQSRNNSEKLKEASALLNSIILPQ